MANQANIKAVITAEDKASAVIKDFGSNTDKQFGKLAGAVAVGTAAYHVLYGAIGKVGDFLQTSLKSFETQELAVSRLQAGINNVRSATDKNIDSLLKQATALQKNTRFSDEAYISAQGILSTFQLNQKAIEKLTPRLADMSEGLARVTGEMPDLEGNAILVAKAIGGEDVNGLTGALRRVGVVMTKAQEDLLKTGSVEDRVSIITEILDQNFKNMATTAGKTTAGRVAELKNQFGELQEKVGGFLARGLTPLLSGLNNLISSFNNQTEEVGIGKLAYDRLQQATQNLKAAQDTAKQSADQVTTAQNNYNQALKDFGPQSDQAIDALNKLHDAQVQDEISKSDAKFQQELYNAAEQIFIDSTPGVSKAIQERANRLGLLVDKLGDGIDSAETLDQYLSGIKSKDVSSDIINALKSGGLNLEHRAVGGPVMGGTPYLVGERGPELIVPKQDGTVIPNNKLGNTVNININAGALMGNDVEARKFALLIQRHLQDARAMKGAF